MAESGEQDFKKVTKLISVLEDSDLSVKFSLLNELYVDKSEPSSIVVGFTGAPGSGKSSLLFEILRRLSQSFKPFVVFAVDPSSHFTGRNLRRSDQVFRAQSGPFPLVCHQREIRRFKRSCL